MRTDSNTPETAATVQHFLAGLAVWVVFMAAYAIA